MLLQPPQGRCWIAWSHVFGCALLIYVTVPLARWFQGMVVDHVGRESFTYAVLAAVAAAAVWSFQWMYRRREHFRPRNWMWLCLVTTVFVVWTLDLRAAPEEALHFIEYGLLGVLLFRALTFRQRSRTVFLTALLVGACFGAFDEIVQWFTPRRYFDYRDILLNLSAVGLVQLALWQGFAPPYINRPVSAGSFRAPAAACMVLLSLLFFCVSVTPTVVQRAAERWPVLDGLRNNPSVLAEYGYRHHLPEIGSFYSRMSQAELKAADKEKAQAAAEAMQELGQPDDYAEFLKVYSPGRAPFLHEFRVHVFSRDGNIRMAENKYRNYAKEYNHRMSRAWREQLILEQFFSNSMTQAGLSLFPAQREKLLTVHMPDMEYQSLVSKHLITRVTKRQLQGVILFFFIACASFLYMKRPSKGARDA